MASVERRAKQVATNNAYYINVGDIRTKIFYNQGTDEAPLISTCYLLDRWSTNVSSQLATAGGAVLRDMGKNLVSSGRIFRKVQLLGQTGLTGLGNGGNFQSTGGVAGPAGASSPDYCTAYIELPGLQGAATGGLPTPVARLG